MKEKILSLFLMVMMIASVISLPASATDVEAEEASVSEITALGGGGSLDDPWEIGTAEQLVFAVNQINSGIHGAYILTADIDMSGVEFPMIDTLTAADTFDGNDHKILNMSINDTSQTVSDSDGYRVAFVRTNQGKICNLIFVEPTVTTTAVSTNGYSGAAVVVGDNQKGGIISRVSVINGNVQANGMSKAGGIAALNGRASGYNATIRYCSFTGTLSCGQRTGEWGPMIGGITAHNHSSVLEYCIADADMSIVGHSTKLRAGGIAGYVDKTNSTIRYNVVYSGSVVYADDAANTKLVQPLRGEGGTVNFADNIVSDDFSVNESVYSGTVDGAAIVSADSLHAQEVYEAIGWDFTDDWKMENGLPVLRGLNEIAPVSLAGSGTSTDPYQIKTENDLAYIAKRLNKGDGRLQEKYFRLQNDIEMTSEFPMIDRFDGELDGAGYTIKNLTINDSGNSGTKADYQVGFIRKNYGVIKDIVFENPNIFSDANAKEDGYSGAAVVAGENQDGAVITGIWVKDAVVNVPDMSKAAGITALNGRDPGVNGSISNCVVSGTLSCGERKGNYGSQIGGISAYSATSTIESCITDVKMTIEGAPKNSYAGGICGYSNSVTYTGNVVYGGSIACNASVSIYTGRIYGYYPYETDNNILTNNLANEAFIINGATVRTTAAKQGISKTAEELNVKTSQSTYDEIGYDFNLQWKIVDEVNYPVPKVFGIDEGTIGCITVTPGSDASKEMNFNWYYNGVSAVQVSETESFEETETFEATGNGKNWKACASGLKADTTYFYRIYDEANNVASETGTFATASESGTFSFVSMSDTAVKDGSTLKLAVSTMQASQLAVEDSRFILHSGDILGNASEKNWQIFLTGAKEVLNSTIIAPAAGDNDGAGFSDYLNVGNEKGYYSFDYSNAHFVVLNTNDSETQCLSEEQLAWLREDVNKAHNDEAIDWVILNLHKGPYTSGSYANAPEILKLREVLIPLIDELGIDLVIQGHDRILGRTYTLKGGTISDERAYTEMVNGKRFDYTIDPDGTVYLETGSAGREINQQISSMDDLDAYISLFERSDQRSGKSAGKVQTFAGVTIDGERLSVSAYEVKQSMSPTMIEGFGIDKEVNDVKQMISDGNLNAAREAYDALTDTQKKQVTNYGELVASESGITKDNAAKWLDDSAKERRSITVRNDTGLDFEDAPVRIQIEDAPSEKMAFYTAEGEVLSCEVENYNKKGTSTVWVKVPEIKADDVTALWVYFGGNDSSEKSENVWSNGYDLVEHFAADLENETKLTDSTGKQTGTVSGNFDIDMQNGEMAAAFENGKITYDSIGDDYDRLTVSAVVSGNDLAGAIVSKYDPASAANIYLLEAQSGNKLHSYYSCMWWRSIKKMENNYYNALPADDEQHLITVTYDGFTVVTYIDGKVASEDTVFIESATLLSKDKLATVIGDYSGESSRPFNGTLYEVQISGNRTSAEWEAFRANNYLGDAVTVGEPEKTDTLTITADAAGKDDTNAVGKQIITGIVSKEAVLTATACGEVFDLGTVKAGVFTVEVPVAEQGTQQVQLTASADGKKATASIVFNMEDTQAPAQPALSNTATGQKLTVTANAEEGEKLDVKFYMNESIVLNEENLEICEGTTNALTPDEVDPAAGTYTAVSAIGKTSTGEDETPYQIYRFSLTEEEQQEAKYHITWSGESQREVHAYAYDCTNRKWVKVGTTTGTGEVSIDATIEGATYLDENGRIYVMFFRGLGTTPADMEATDSLTPKDGQYDFTMFWNSDTQYMTQFYPEMALHQHEWIAENFSGLKGTVTFNTGDIANRSNLNYEYNWRVVDDAYKIFEENGVPYTFSWGNHDYRYDGKENEERLNNKYFPESRVEGNLTDSGSSWKVAGNYNNMNNFAIINEINGAKIMLLSIGYHYNNDDIAWADGMIAEYPDYNVFILTHDCTYNGKMNNKAISSLVEKHTNVKLVFSGHIDGTDCIRPYEGREFYGILQDYQGEDTALTYGGQEFMRLVQFDVENNLVYINTYSPRTGETLSLYGKGTYADTNGLYQKNRDEFVIELDLGAVTQRSFTTNTLTLSAGDAKEVGSGATMGNAHVDVAISDLTAGNTYEWYAVLTDAAGNVTQSLPVIFIAEEEKEEKPETPETPPSDDDADENKNQNVGEGSSSAGAVPDNDKSDSSSSSKGEIPDTGDSSNVGVWLFIPAISGVLICGALGFRKKIIK